MSATTPFQFLRREGHLLEVGVDDVNVLLPNSNKSAIGTQGLNGCTCVIILSTTAILLAHISPLPGSFTDWVHESAEARHRASYNHHESYLQTIKQTVQQHNRHFPTSATSWGIFASDASDKVLQSVITQIQTHLNAMGFGMERAFYKEIETRNFSPPKGEVVGVRRPAGLELYLENTKLWPKPASGLSAQTAFQSASSSASVLRRPVIPPPIASRSGTLNRPQTTSIQFAAMRAESLRILMSLRLTEAVASARLQHYTEIHKRQGRTQDPGQILLRATNDVVRNGGGTEDQAKGILQSIRRAGSTSNDEDDEDDEEDQDDEDED